MISRLLGLLVLLLLLAPSALAREKNSMSNEEMAAYFLRRGLLTKDQHALLRSNEFLGIKCSGEKFSSCVPQVNFRPECGGVTGSVELISDQPEKYEVPSSLVYDISSLGIRVAKYPAALKAFGKWDAAAEKAWSDLKQIHARAVTIANGDNKRVDKLRRAKPLMEQAETISAAMAKAAGFEYDSGCGAAGEDSQIVRFTFAEKPKEALYILQMEFDACRKVLADPYNRSNCEAWRSMQQANELSGNYRYRVTWPDGKVSEQPFSALSTGKKTIEITR